MWRTTVLTLLLVVGAAGVANAQRVSLYGGAGTAIDSANGQTIDSIGDTGPSMSGLFIVAGVDYMRWQTFGIGAEYSMRESGANYAAYGGLTYRPTFYDVNAVWRPVALRNNSIVPEFQGGAGQFDFMFHQADTVCVQSGGCPTLTTYETNERHFQVHFAGGVRVYLLGTPFFVKPQIDVHAVNNLPEFGRSVIPEFSVAVGFDLGRR